MSASFWVLDMGWIYLLLFENRTGGIVMKGTVVMKPQPKESEHFLLYTLLDSIIDSPLYFNHKITCRMITAEYAIFE